MTLVLSLVNSQQAVIVADRRLTSGTTIVTDEQTKLTTLTCLDGRLGIGFSGLASLGSFRTDRWLASTLVECAPPDFAMRPTLQRFEDALAARWKSIVTDDPLSKRLSIVLTGYLYDEDPPRAYTWRLSNWERVNSFLAGPPLSTFEVTGAHEKRPPEEGGEPAVVSIAGVLGVVPQSDLDDLTRLLELRASPRDLTRRAVAVIRDAADHPSSLGTIGKQCLSLVVPRDASSDPWSTYHTEADSEAIYFANQAIGLPSLQIAITDPEIRVEVGGPPMARGKLGRNVPCPCGSGKKFKRCHGV